MIRTSVPFLSSKRLPYILESFWIDCRCINSWTWTPRQSYQMWVRGRGARVPAQIRATGVGTKKSSESTVVGMPTFQRYFGWFFHQKNSPNPDIFTTAVNCTCKYYYDHAVVWHISIWSYCRSVVRLPIVSINIWSYCRTAVPNLYRFGAFDIDLIMLSYACRLYR